MFGWCNCLFPANLWASQDQVLLSFTSRIPQQSVSSLTPWVPELCLPPALDWCKHFLSRTSEILYLAKGWDQLSLFLLLNSPSGVLIHSLTAAVYFYVVKC